MKTITMSVEMFERITKALVCIRCPADSLDNKNIHCNDFKTCGDVMLYLIKKDNEEKGRES